VSLKITVAGSTDRELEGVVRSCGAAPSLVPLAQLPAMAQATTRQADVLIVDLRGQSSVPPALGAFRRQHPTTGILIVSKTLDPDLILSVAEIGVPGYSTSACPGLKALRPQNSRETHIHDDLALLLNTSGSTGSPKLVRLSYSNLQSNAESIHQYLQLTPGEKPIASLPMSYSYGLSVINSHLLAGGTLVLVEHGVLRREFWDCIDLYSCTSLAGRRALF